MRTHFLKSRERGFTIFGIVIVVVIIGLIVAVAVPSLATVRKNQRNTERKAEVLAIMNAVYQYAIDNNNVLPTAITTTPTDICRTGGICTGLIDLSVLTANAKYLPSIPLDPQATAANGTGYAIAKSATTGRVTITASFAESSTITITR